MKNKAPTGPVAGFGRLKCREDYEARIAWERWAADKARSDGHEAIAQGHDLAARAYEERLERMEQRIATGYDGRSYSFGSRVAHKDGRTGVVFGVAPDLTRIHVLLDVAGHTVLGAELDFRTSD
jgi:hypothetical protein